MPGQGVERSLDAARMSAYATSGHNKKEASATGFVKTKPGRAFFPFVLFVDSKLAAKAVDFGTSHELDSFYGSRIRVVGEVLRE